MKELLYDSSDAYQKKAVSFRCDTCNNIAYPLLGMYEEISELIEKTNFNHSKTIGGISSRLILNLLIIQGKLLGKWAKRVRKGKSVVPFTIDSVNEPLYLITAQQKELGDIHWMLANLDDQYGFDSSEVNTMNICKLAARKKSGTIITHTDH